MAQRTDPTPPPPLETAELEARAPRGLTTEESAALRRRLSPRWAFFSFAVLALLALTLWLRYTAPLPAPAAATPEPRPSSVAVLPLVSASPDTADEYLSDGLTGELAAALGRVPGLRVAAPASVLSLRRPNEDPRDAGRRLNVATVLEGSVRQTGNRLRVTVHLVSVSEGFDLWSETYERTPAEIFAVQEEIVRSVVATLRVPGAERWTGSVPATSNLEAYLAYLRAHHVAAGPDGADPAHAAALYQEAIAADSAFAPAWAGLAAAHAARALHGGARPTEAMPAARVAATRALALDSSLAVAHTTLAQIRFLYDRDWPAADSAFQRALRINPNRSEVHHWYAHLLLATGRGDEAAMHNRRALELSPLDPEILAHIGWHEIQTRRFAEARESLDRALAVNATRTETRWLVGLLAEVVGDHELAESHYLAGLERSPDDLDLLASLGRTHALGGRADEAGAVLARLDSLATERWVSPYLSAIIAEALGDRQRAFAWLEDAVADRAGDVVYLDLDPRLDRLRDDRRFARLRRGVGLP